MRTTRVIWSKIQIQSTIYVEKLEPFESQTATITDRF